MRPAISRPLALCMFTLLVLLASSRHLAAQHDVRLSPETISTTIVPDSLRYQAGFVVGPHCLLAFATTRSDGNGGVIGEIRAVHLDSIRPSNETVLSSSEARPSGGMAVRAWGAGAVVLWSDVRGGSRAIYGRMLDASLAPIGAEILVCPGSIASDSSVWLMDRGSAGALLIWNQQDGSGAVARLGSDLTMAVGDRVETTDAVLRVRVLSSLPGAVLLSGAAGKEGHLVREDGVIDPRRVPASLVSGEVAVNADTSVGVARDTVVARYASLFDSVAVWSRSITIGGRDYLPGRVLTVDSSGHYVLYFSGPKGYRYYWVQLFKARFSRDGAPLDTAFIDSLEFVDYLSGYNCIASIDGFAIVPSCDQIAVRIVFTTSYGHNSSNPNGWTSSRNDGFVVTQDGAYFHRWDASIEACGRAGLMGARRSLIGARNTFTVLHAGGERSYAHIAEGTSANAGQTLPTIVGVSDESLIFSYQDDAADHPELLASWNVGSVNSAMVIDGIGPTPSSQPRAAGQPRASCRQFRQSNVALVLAETQSLLWTENSPYYQYYTESASFYMPTRSVWANVGGVYATSSAGQPQCYPVIARAAGSGDMQLAYNTGYMMATNAVARFDSLGHLLWYYEGGDLQRPQLLIPLSGHRFLELVNGSMRLMDSTHLVRRFPWDHADAYDRCWALSGDRFLYWRVDVAGLILEVVDTNGVITGFASFPLTEVGDVAVVERADSDLIVVAAATPHGLRGLFLSEKLIARRGLDSTELVDVPLSETHDSVAHPTMTLAGDSVVTVWEDFRNGNPDIYGAVRTAPRMLDQKEESSQPADSTPGTPPGVTIYPNPTVSGLAVGVKLDAPSDISIDLVDPLGRRLEHQSLGHLNAGSYQYHLDLEDVIPGAYFVTVTAAGGISAQPVVVMRK